ncbi:uncharacterized protein LOC130628786 [Hydractinia symbiolongicarpus]|uniref:uncharacterized protein LOC130628786 n=1 Tax=Hydractinia symbiolongicarpus TaxID=13093 RepID=UPI00254AA56A|nr:uncharacterized protein LOC130628786 [Hydractinia symbiolongicarpus]
MDYEQLFLAYKLSRHFTEEREEGKRFCILLYDGESFTVDDIFASSLQYDHPVLECVSSWLFSKNTDSDLNHIVQKVNSCLKECFRQFQIKCENLRNHPFRNVGSNSSSIPFETADRKKLYYKIADDAVMNTNYIAHFLLPYNEIFKLKKDPTKNKNVLYNVLRSWDDKTEVKGRTWNHLKSVLLFLSHEKLVHDIEGKDECDGFPVAIPRYQTHKDCNENIIITLISPIPNITITSHSENEVRKLEKQSEYKEEVCGDKMLIQVFKNNYFTPDKLEISTLDDPVVNISIPIEDTPHLHSCQIENIQVITHGYTDILEFLHKIQNVEETNAIVEYISNGGNHRTKLSRNEWYALCWEYLRTYFSLKDATHITEAIQFPPYRKGNKISELAYLLKNVLMEKENVGVITSYNTEEHLNFLKYSAVKNHGNYQNRILIIFPNPLIFVNIRYLKSENFCDLEDEIRFGENDIKALLFLNKQLLINKNKTFLNIIAAPNLTNCKDSLICGMCYILYKNDMKNKENLTIRLNNILTDFCHASKCSTDRNLTFMRIISNIFGFLATRKSIRNYVPAITSQPAEQIQSLMLNIEQLKILYSDEKKKIIFGNFGSGKSLLALYQIKDLVEFADKETVIYYICWNLSSMLVHDIRKFVKTIQKNYLVKIHIFNIVDMCAHLNLTSLPSLSVFIIKLIQKYPETVFHLCVDEFDGEQLDFEAATELKETLQRKELIESHVTILPHSLSKKRTFVSKEKKQPHSSYRYKETGMKIFKLTKCMRTTEKIFKLTKAIGEKICEENSVIYQPRQLDSNTMLLQAAVDIHPHDGKRNNDLKLSATNFTGKYSTTHPEESSLLNMTKGPSLDINEYPDDRKTSPATHSLSIHKKSLLERPLDIEVIAANTNQVLVHKSRKTLTQYEYPETSSVGHNITGCIPKYVTFVEQNDFSMQSLSHDLTSKLAILLKNWFSQNSIRILVLCNTPFHYFVMKSVLKLLNIDFIEYIDYSDWQPTGKTGELASLTQSKCTLTNYVGSRGNEADKVMVVIDPAATKLKHLTLECMTRCQDDLLIIGINDPLKSKKKRGFRTIFNLQKSESSIGKILDEVEDDGLLQRNQWSSISLDDEEISIVKEKLQINVQSKTYREYLDVLKDVEVPFKDIPRNINMDATALKQLQITDSVKNLKCSYKNEKECSLNWEAEGFTYIIRAKETHSNSDWYEVCRTRQSPCTVKNLKLVSRYMFSVTAVSSLDHSEDKVVEYFHNKRKCSDVFADIKKLIRDENIDEFQRLLSILPNIVHMRDEEEDTPLMWTARYTDNSSMVKLLIKYGCDVWAFEKKYELNSYHYAARNDRHTILNTLCRHDVTYINRGNVNNWTPLHLASLRGYISCVDVLLRHTNIDVAIKSKNGQTAYDMAGRGDNKQNRDIIRLKITDYEKSRKKSGE